MLPIRNAPVITPGKEQRRKSHGNKRTNWQGAPGVRPGSSHRVGPEIVVAEREATSPPRDLAVYALDNPLLFLVSTMVAVSLVFLGIYKLEPEINRSLMLSMEDKIKGEFGHLSLDIDKALYRRGDDLSS